MRRPLLGILLAFALAAAACSSGDPAESGPSAGSPSPTTPQPAVSSPRPCADEAEHPFTVVMRDFRFVPRCLVVTATVPFHLRNRGSTKHNLTIPGTKFSADVAPGEAAGERDLMSAGVGPGTYEFFCSFHRSQGMTGELHVLAA